MHDIAVIAGDGIGPEVVREGLSSPFKELPPKLYRPEAVTVDQVRLLKIKGIDLAQARVETLDPARVRIRQLPTLAPLLQ